MIGSTLLCYDRAVFKKIHKLYDEVIYAAPEECFKVNAKAHKGRVLLPFISLWRMPDFSVNRDMYNDSYVRKGPRRMSSSNTEFPNQYVQMHGLPVTLQYQLDVYATKRDVCDGLMAEIVLEMYENPWVDVEQKGMGDNWIQQFNIDIDDNISDNTSISEFDESNRFYRLTATLEMPEALIHRIDRSKPSIEKVEVAYEFDNTIVDDIVEE